MPRAPAPGLAAQKKTLRAAERDRADVAEERAAWRAEVTAGRLDPTGLIFVDESGIDTRMTRRFARARRGERARGAVPFGRWRSLTLIGALGLGGLAAQKRRSAPPSRTVATSARNAPPGARRSPPAASTPAS